MKTFGQWFSEETERLSEVVEEKTLTEIDSQVEEPDTEGLWLNPCTIAHLNRGWQERIKKVYEDAANDFAKSYVDDDMIKAYLKNNRYRHDEEAQDDASDI